jgi:hypothetical protein
MRIDFEDGSFITLIPENSKMTLVTCGRKSIKETVMSSSNLTLEQVGQVANFLNEWLKTVVKE